MSASIELPTIDVLPEHLVDVATMTTEVMGAKDLEVSAHKKEYSIVGDALFATVSADDAPTWLTDILSTVIGNGLDLALGDLNSARLDLSSALSSMHIAKNEFVEAINTQADEFGVLVSRIESQNASLNTAVNQVSADISSLQTTAVTPTEASALAADQIAASLNTPGHALHGAVSDVSSVVTSVADLGDSVGGFLDALGTVEENLAISFAQKITEVEAQVSGVTVGSRNLIPKTSEEEDGPDYEFFAYRDMAPTFEEYGLIEYTIGVDLKSPVPGNVNIYAQNGNGTRYSIGTKSCDVTTEWKRFTYTFTPTESDMAQTKAMVAFFGTYGTGRNIKLRRFKLERGNRASDWTPAPEDVSQAAVDAADAAEKAARDYADQTFVGNTVYGQDMAKLQAQLDQSITTWFMTGVPTAATLPASEWDTPEKKALHEGDLYYDDTPGFSYRYKMLSPDSYGWVVIEDEAVITALGAASGAQDTADSKRRVFFTPVDSLPPPPYDEGDLWDTGGGLKRADVAKARDSTPSADDWVDVTDGAGAAEAAEQAAKDYADQTFVDVTSYGQDIAQIQTQIDKSITTWFEDGAPTLSNAPASSWETDTDKDVHLGDLYYDNLTGYSYRFKKNGSTYSWNKISDSDVTAALAAAANAQDTADGKRRVFYATPIAPYDKGDLWDTGSGLRRANIDVAAGGSYSLSHWVAVADGAGAAADVYAKVEQNMTSFAALDAAGNPLVGANFGVKLTTAVNGETLIGGFDLTNNGSSTSAVFDVDAFKVGRADAAGVSPFEVDGDVTSIKNAFIKDLDIGKLSLGGTSVVTGTGNNVKIKAEHLEVEQVDISGLLNATDGTFSGTLNIGGGVGARMEITNDYIKVYDESGRLRVHLGDLSQ